MICNITKCLILIFILLLGGNGLLWSWFLEFKQILLKKHWIKSKDFSQICWTLSFDGDVSSLPLSVILYLKFPFAISNHLWCICGRWCFAHTSVSSAWHHVVSYWNSPILCNTVFSSSTQRCALFFWCRSLDPVSCWIMVHQKRSGEFPLVMNNVCWLYYVKINSGRSVICLNDPYAAIWMWTKK